MQNVFMVPVNFESFLARGNVNIARRLLNESLKPVAPLVVVKEPAKVCLCGLCVDCEPTK